MPDQVLGVDPDKLFLADREADDRDVRRLDALVGEFLIEGHVGVAVDRGNDRGLLAGAAEFLDLGNLGLPVGEAEGRVILANVGVGDTLGMKKGADDLVAGARIDIVRPFEHPALDAAAARAHQIFDRRHGFVARHRAAVEDVVRGFLAFIFEGIEQEAVQLLEDRQHRFARYRGPAAEDRGHLVLGDKLARLFREKRPVGCGIDHDRLDLLAEQSAMGVQLVDLHQHEVFEDGLADRHRARQRMQDADLDRILSPGGADRG